MKLSAVIVCFVCLLIIFFMNRNDIVIPNLYYLQKLSINEINQKDTTSSERRFFYGNYFTDFANIITISRDSCPHIKITRADIIDERLTNFFVVKCIYYIIAFLFFLKIVANSYKIKKHFLFCISGSALIIIMFIVSIFADISSVYIPEKDYSVNELKKLLCLPSKVNKSCCISEGTREIIIGKNNDFGCEFACINVAPGELIYVGANLTYETMQNLCNNWTCKRIKESIFLCKTKNIKSFYNKVFIWLMCFFMAYVLLFIACVFCVISRLIIQKRLRLHGPEDLQEGVQQ